MNLRVDTHIGGSKCVVWKNKGHYIDVRLDVRYPAFSFIECVRSGQVYLRDSVPDKEAPERIVELMRKEFK